MKIISVVGARPNFMKIAPIHKAIASHNLENGIEIEHKVCHTGQHYDEKMSKIFFEELRMPKPDYYLGVGSGSHAEQTAAIMIGFEKVLLIEKPDLVIVVGDVNSTIACALTAKKMCIKVAHIEAGLRSFDMQMPEEINRILTDRISDYLFVSEPSGVHNLSGEGVSSDKIFYVGNIMIDSLIEHLQKAENSEILNQLGLIKKNKEKPSYEGALNKYILITLHRPSNVDDPEFLKYFLQMLNRIAVKRKVIFPVHPRTKAKIDSLTNNNPINDSVLLTSPFGYLDFIKLEKYAELIITDSGGVQEESTYLGVQCITVRENTERPITITHGTNTLAGIDLKRVEEIAFSIIGGNKKNGIIPDKWDGFTAKRIISQLYYSTISQIPNMH